MLPMRLAKPAYGAKPTTINLWNNTPGIITREKRRLLGLVRSVETEFVEFEIIEGNAVEIGYQPAGNELYDSRGRLIEEITPERSVTEDSYKDIYVYDAEGRLISRDEYREDGSIIGKTTFKQDENGNRIERNYYFDCDGLLKLRSYTIYDPDGKHLETAYYNEKEEIDPRRIYKACSKQLTKVNENTIIRDEGYVVESFHYDEKGEWRHRKTTSFDSRGNEKELSTFTSDEMLVQKTIYDYDYDSTGNWTKQFQYCWTIGWGEFRLILWAIIRRKIDYY